VAIAINFQGGLGNQMFQYALGECLAYYKNVKVFYDHSTLEDKSSKNDFVNRKYELNHFSINPPKFHRWKRNLLVSTPVSICKNPILKVIKYFNRYEIYNEKSFSYDSNVFLLNRNLYLNGYWQSPKYFEKIENKIKDTFSFSKILPQSRELAEMISSEKSVCVNVRRADYISIQSTAEILGFVGEEYYLESMKAFRNWVPNCKFYVFSDDLEWCYNFFQNQKDVFIVDHSHAGVSFINYMQLMSKSHNFIIPNSTFAWWSAWLSKSSRKKVVCPKKWFNKEKDDIVPTGWIRF
jgi:hypothetical protein